MPVVQRPIGDVFGSARALQAWRELRPDFAGMTVAELVKDAAVFVEDAVVGMDQLKKAVAREKIRTVAFRQRRVLIGEPGRAVAVVIDGC